MGCPAAQMVRDIYSSVNVEKSWVGILGLLNISALGHPLNCPDSVVGTVLLSDIKFFDTER